MGPESRKQNGSTECSKSRWSGDRLHMSERGRERLQKIKRKSGQHLDVLKVGKKNHNLEM